MGRKSRFEGGPGKTISVKLGPELYAWFKDLGLDGPALVRELLDNERLSGRVDKIDRRLDTLRGDLNDTEAKSLAINKEIRELETRKSRLVSVQLKYLDVRTGLIEKYLKNPAGFVGWLTGPANEHLITEGKFATAREVLEYCQGEVDKRRGENAQH